MATFIEGQKGHLAKHSQIDDALLRKLEAADLAASVAAERIVQNATFAAANPTLTVTYNGDGSVASTTEDSILTTFTYNGDGTVATQTRAGITKTFSYDGNGNVTGAN